MATVEVHNPNDILKRLSTLLQTGDLSDLTLKVNGQGFQCHRLLLCASSDVFNTMLTSRLWPEGRSDIVVLREDPECAAVFQHFLEYLYTGQVTLEKHNVLPLLTLADKYNVPSLSSSCLNYMVDGCCPSTLKYILHWLQYAIICGYTILQEKCMQFITANFDEAVYTQDFNQISRDVLIAFLRQDDLVVSSELDLYVAVRLWFETNKNESSEDNETLFHSVMKHIKFPMISLKELIQLEDHVCNHGKFFLQNIFCALKYHTGSKIKFSEGLLKQLKEREKFQPRVYVTETWSTEIVVENVSQLAEGAVRGAFFSTPKSYAEIDQSTHRDWHVMFYPRGVVYSDCQMISWMNCLINPGGKFETVRLALSTHCKKRRKFKITVLVMGTCETSEEEFVYAAKTTDAIFDSDCTLFNFENIIPYEEVLKKKSPFKINDRIKLNIVIRPEFQNKKNGKSC